MNVCTVLPFSKAWKKSEKVLQLHSFLTFFFDTFPGNFGGNGGNNGGGRRGCTERDTEYFGTNLSIRNNGPRNKV